MTPEEVFAGAITGDAAVTALIGTNLYADSLSESARAPMAVYQRGETEPVRTLGSRLVGSFIEMNILVFATTRASCDQICDALEVALETVKYRPTVRTAGYEAEPRLESERMTFRYWHAA